MTLTDINRDTILRKENCCNRLGRIDDCNDKRNPVGVAVNDVIEFATDEEAWFSSFLEAWRAATENGISFQMLES